MDEWTRSERNGRQGKLPGTGGSRPLPGLQAAYAMEVKKLTNYEVWKGVEAALRSPASGGDPEGIDSWILGILLDELKWRLSGLEGVKSNSDWFSLNVRPN